MEAVDPDRPELLAILRERRLAKARVRDVACPFQHRIAQVVKISMGLLWIGELAALDGEPGKPQGRTWGAALFPDPPRESRR